MVWGLAYGIRDTSWIPAIVDGIGCPTLRLLLIDFRGKMLFFLTDLVMHYKSISSQNIEVSAILQIELPLESTSLWKEKHFEASN